MLIARLKARPFPRHAVDILGPAAPAADEMVMVVPDPPLETSGMPGGLDPPQQSRVGARGQHAVDGLQRQRRILFPYALGDRVGGGVRVRGQPGQHGLARHRDPQPRRSQFLHYGILLTVRSVTLRSGNHDRIIFPPFLESIKNLRKCLRIVFAASVTLGLG